MIQHRAFELSVCAHSQLLADFIRTKLDELRQAIENHDDLHAFQLIERQQREDDGDGDDGEGDEAEHAGIIRAIALKEAS